MRLVYDKAAQAAALKTCRELVAQGFLGVDYYDHDLVVCDPPDWQTRDLADIAIDALGGDFHRNGAYGSTHSVRMYRLPTWARKELGLDEAEPPTLITPLASRAVSEHRLAAAPANAIASIFGGAV